MTSLIAEDLVVQRRGVPILAGIDLCLPDTGTVALIGPNGAGKSTLLRVFAGLLTPTAGRVMLDGHPIAAMDAKLRAQLIGFVPQHFAPHWDLRVEDLVQLGWERAGGARLRPIRAVMEDHELVPIADRRWSVLSGGERARVVLAMVLAADPPVLLADEPGASLDIRHRLALADMLARRDRDRLCVVAMHDLDLAFRMFDHVILLAGARVLVAGRSDDVFRDAQLDSAFGVEFARLQGKDGVSLQVRARRP